MNIEHLNATLKGLKIKASCKDYRSHRHFAQYDLELTPGFRVNQLMNYTQEIALAMKFKSNPIFKSITSEGIVRMQTTIGSPEAIKLSDLRRNNDAPNMFFPCLLGETDQGKALWMDIAKNPHLLVAGSTGSGKSILLHTIIKNAVESSRVKVYLSDCKKVEFAKYRDNSSVKEIAVDYRTTLNMLEYLIKEMDARYQALQELGISSVLDSPGCLRRCLVVVDEVADLMEQDKSGRLESAIVRLAANFRAAGIYLILSTQHPTVKVLTGSIKANFPARLACKVSSQIDSRVILDSIGAENLIGKGDALFKSPEQELTRFQVAMPI